MARKKKLTVADLVPHEDNPRTIEKPNRDRLAALMDVYGDLANITYNSRTGKLVGGHQRMSVLREKYGDKLRIEENKSGAHLVTPDGSYPVRVVDWDEPTARAAMIAANSKDAQGTFDDVQLAGVVLSLEEDGIDLADTGLSTETLAELLQQDDPPPVPPVPPAPDTSRIDELRKKWKVETGQVWEIGRHRLLCGDTTDSEKITAFLAGTTLTLVHADPPYGMGKEKDGIANDNLYKGKLDAFQTKWWEAWRPSLVDNGSAYVWGNAPDLWRWWYSYLSDSERLTFRNEVVWAKGSGQGMSSEERRGFATETERCLFFMLGEQGFNHNADNYWEGWDPIRLKLEEDCKIMGWTAKDIKRICGVGMYTHWFTRSQWEFIPEEHYKKLQEAARDHDAFKRDHDELKRDHDAFKRDHDELKRDFYATRAFFDNAHDNMTDVWIYPRVVGEDRHDHATPKSVEMVARAVKSSSRPGDNIGCPFGGTGPEFVAAEQLDRTCYGVEIDPGYCAIVLERMAAMGLEPELV